MKIKPLHRWDLTTAEARDLQLELASEIDITAPLEDWQTVAAVDGSWNKFEPECYGAVVVMERGTFNLIERAGVAAPVRFPYVPGLLSFREIPVLLEAMAQLKHRPDVILCDAQGYAHPRRFGLACHLGLVLGIPTVGCAKSRLIGEFEQPGPKRGDRSPLLDKGEPIGVVLRTRDRVKPLFISSGHLCNLESAVDVVLATTAKYRLPVPSAAVHQYVNDVRRAAMAKQPLPR